MPFGGKRLQSYRSFFEKYRLNRQLEPKCQQKNNLPDEQCPHHVPGVKQRLSELAPIRPNVELRNAL